MGPAVPVPPCLGLRVALGWWVGGWCAREPGMRGGGEGRVEGGGAPRDLAGC